MSFSQTPDTREYISYSEPIGVIDANQSSYISTKFSLMKRGMICRELIKNIIEAPFSPSETVRIAYIEPLFDGYHAPKLAFFNTCGKGFEGDELVEITEASGTTKVLESHGGTNHGEGSKYACLNYNELGMIWTSRKNGVITRVELFKKDNHFHRRSYRAMNVYQQYVIMDDESLSREDRERYGRVDGDFVDIKLLGNAIDQNTFQNPYGDVNPEANIVLHEITTRFASLKCENTLKLIYKDEHNVEMQIRTFNDIVESSTDIRHERVSDANVEIDYYYFNGDAKIPNPFETNFHQGTRVALEYRDEFYSVIQGKSWSNKCGQYGFGGMGRNISVIVRPVSCRDTDDRTSLMAHNTDITVDDFVWEMQRLMPKWLFEIIRSKPSRASRDVQNECQQLLNTLTKINAIPATDTNFDVVAVQKIEASKGPSRASPMNHDGTHSRGNPKTAPETGDNTREVPNVPTKVSLRGPQSSPISAPAVEWLYNLSGYSELQGKGCSYTKGSGFYQMNARHWVFDHLIDTVMTKYAPAYMIGNKEARSIVEEAVKFHCAMEVGKTIVRNLARINDPQYNAKEIYSHGLSTIALTTSYETCSEHAGSIWNRMSRQTDWGNLSKHLGPKGAKKPLQLTSSLKITA